MTCSACCNVSEWLKFKIIAVVIYYHEVLLSIQCEQVDTSVSLTMDVRVS